MRGYIFLLKNNENVENLAKLVEKVSSTASWIGVSSIPEHHEELKRVLDSSGVKYNLIINTENFSDYYLLDQFITNLPIGWTYVHEVGKFFRHDVDNVVNNFVVAGGKFAMIAEDYEDINDTCLHNLIYWHLRGNKPEPDEVINFYGKVEKREPHMIKKWSDIYELQGD